MNPTHAQDAADPRQPAPGLARLNALPAAEATAALLTCCGAGRWAAAMVSQRPFASAGAVYARADAIWQGLAREDWLEAFSHHPRIGERNLAQPQFTRTAEQSAREQSGMAGAAESVQREFVSFNAEYERRFGHVFLICATGKSADFMLAQLKTRLGNDAATELRNAAQEQSMIVRLRLERMLTA